MLIRKIVIANSAAVPRLAQRGTGAEPPRRFSFVVRWTTLMAAWNLHPPADPTHDYFSEIPAPVYVDLAALATLDTTEPPLPVGPDFENRRRGRWQMVVPKMVRPPSRTSAMKAFPPSARTVPDTVFRQKVLEAPVASPHRDSSEILNMALSLQRSQQWEKALAAFARAAALDPNPLKAGLGAGVCLLHLSRFEEALSLFSRDYFTRNDLTLFGRAVALQLLQRFDEALEAYEGLPPALAHAEEVLCNLIALSIDTHDLERVRYYSSTMLGLRPKSMAALQGLATVALEDSNGADAVYYCDRILAESPWCLEAWHNFRIAVNSWHIESQAPASPFLVERTQ